MFRITKREKPDKDGEHEHGHKETEIQDDRLTEAERRVILLEARVKVLERQPK